jgi:hypothetical protein
VHVQKSANALLTCTFCRRIIGGMKTHTLTTTQSLAEMSPSERRRKINVREAAALNDLSEATFRRHYGHLIRKITPRRDAVELCDAIDLPPPQAKTT